MEAAPIARRNAAIAPFHVMEVQTAARALEAQGVDVVHMEIGEPDFPAPAPVLAAARAALDDGAIFYTSALGLPALREAIAGHYRDHYGVAVDPARIVVTAGSSAALLLVLGLIVDRDSALLMADPHYPCNRNIVATLEGVAQTVPVDAATRYQLTAALVDRNWQPSTRGVLVATPSNPTGTTIDHDELARIAAVVARRGGHLVVDEIYLGLTYGAPARSALDVANDAFIISSFSKHFNMTGWRLGWIVAPERHVRAIEMLAQNLYISPTTLSQRAALACFAPATMAIVEERRRAFEARRDYLVGALRGIGFGVPVMPDGGFFVYADCSRFSQDAAAFCRDALAHTGVAITPGIDFGQHRARSHVRFAYTVDQAKIATGVARLRDWLHARPAAAHA
jgi:aspartate/methionine/tyrosine aminotransferase